jgi:hypothetical protein
MAMNIDKTYLQRRIEFIQDILDNPSQLDVPHPKGYFPPANSFIEPLYEHLILDNTISIHILSHIAKLDKLLFSAHKFQTSETILTDFEYDKCRVDYCFVYDNDGLQQPYAIGIETDEPFNGWWARHPKVTLPLTTNPIRNIPLFFVTQKQIFVQFYGLHSDLPRADKLDGIPQFIEWLKGMKLSASDVFKGRNGIYEFESEHPLHKHLKAFI